MAKHDLGQLQLWISLAQTANFNAEEFARLCRISTRQLRRHCQERFGRSTQEWLDEQRIIAAGHLLKELRCVKRVAIELGFKQRTHFSRQFKQYYGLSPSEFIDSHVNLSVFSRQKIEEIKSAELRILANALEAQNTKMSATDT